MKSFSLVWTKSKEFVFFGHLTSPLVPPCRTSSCGRHSKVVSNLILWCQTHTTASIQTDESFLTRVCFIFYNSKTFTVIHWFIEPAWLPVDEAVLAALSAVWINVSVNKDKPNDVPIGPCDQMATCLVTQLPCPGKKRTQQAPAVFDETWPSVLQGAFKWSGYDITG